MTANPHRPDASRLAPGPERCPACGQERARAELWHKHHKLTCCTACYQQRRLDKRQRWEQRNRARRTRQRRQGGVPCPPYVAWTWETFGLGVYVIYRQPGWPEASVMPAYGACSCGEAGCVHLVVALLASQEQAHA